VSWRDENGKQHNKVTGKGRAGQRDANDLDKDIKAKKRVGLEPTPARAGHPYLDDIAQAFIDAKKAEGKKASWLKPFASMVQANFYENHCQRPAKDLTYSEIVNVIAINYSDKSPTTRSRYLSYLKIMFRFAVDHGYLEKNPLALWKKPKEKPRRSMLTISDLGKIMDKAPPHLRWAMELAFNLGVRTGESELLALTWANVDFESGLIRVYATKTNTWRNVHVSDAFLARLKQMKEQALTDHLVEYRGKPVVCLRRSFRTACKLAKITYDVILYDIRHLYATTLLSRGGDLVAVSKQMGHSSTVMTANVYYQEMAGERKRAVELLPQLTPVSGAPEGPKFLKVQA
jgi:integrase